MDGSFAASPTMFRPPVSTLTWTLTYPSRLTGGACARGGEVRGGLELPVQERRHEPTPEQARDDRPLAQGFVPLQVHALELQQIGLEGLIEGHLQMSEDVAHLDVEEAGDVAGRVRT